MAYYCDEKISPLMDQKERLDRELQSAGNKYLAELTNEMASTLIEFIEKQRERLQNDPETMTSMIATILAGTVNDALRAQQRMGVELEVRIRI